jgi:hypothetical protein
MKAIVAVASSLEAGTVTKKTDKFNKASDFSFSTISNYRIFC